MATTLRFKQLIAELRRLRSHFLPYKWEPTGSYSERKFDRARAYRILVHAEIEFYIENLLLDTVEQKYQAWKVAKSPSYIMTCLVIASKMEWQDVETETLELKPLDLKQIKIRRDDDSIHGIIERAVIRYRDIVKDNNGIKTVDLKRLLMPVGIAMSDLDPTWLNNMNSFGGQRGFIAHTSRLGVKNVLDPKTEKDTVDNLLKGLKDLDTMISAL